MKIEYLEYLLTVSKAPSISAAAQRLFISQTALSAAIRAIENEIKVELFQRTSKGIKLTAQGMHVCAVAEEIVEKYHSLFSPDLFEQQSLSIGVYTYNYNALSRFLLKHLRENGYSFQLNIVEVKENEVVNSLLDGAIDIGIGVAFGGRHRAYRSLAEANGLLFDELCQDQAYLYVSANSPLASEKTVRLAELREEYFATTPNHFKAFKDAGLHKRMPHYCLLGNTAAVIEAIEANNMISFLPVRTMRENVHLQQGHIKQLPIEDIATAGIHYLVWCPGKLTAPVRFVLNMLKQFYET